MNEHDRKTLVVRPWPCRSEEIGRALWRLQNGRQRTLEALHGLSDSLVDRHPAGETGIGTILYHIALIEADWLYSEVMESQPPDDVAAWFPLEHRDAAGKLTTVSGYTLEQHLQRLAAVRERLLQTFQPMELSDFRRARSLPDYDVTPEWVLHHLTQHEAEHRGQITGLRAALER